MKEVFAELPIIIKADDKELGMRLLKEIRRVSIQTNNSPEHNYFIGLAYLNGIDVEIDIPKGIELIQSSAESGLLVACNKMIDIYKNGIGVKINYDEVIKWTKNKITILEENPILIDDLFDAYIHV